MRASVWKTTGEAIERSPYRLLVRSKWEVLFRPISAKSGKPYDGSNLGLLSWYLSVHPDKIPIFMTFDAAKKLVFTKPNKVPTSLTEFRSCITFAKNKITGQHIRKGTKSAPIVIPLPTPDVERDEQRTPWLYKTLPLFSICDISGADDTIGAMMETLNAMQRQHMEQINVEPLTTQAYLLMILKSARFKLSKDGWLEAPPTYTERTSIVGNTISTNLANVNPSSPVFTTNELGTLIAYLFDFVSEQLEVRTSRNETDEAPKKKRKIDTNKVKAVSVILTCEYILGTLAAACQEELTDAHCLYVPFTNVASSWCYGYKWGLAINFGVSEHELKKAVTDAISVGNMVLDGSISGIVNRRVKVVAYFQSAFPQFFGPFGEYAFNVDVLQRILRYAYPIPRPLKAAAIIAPVGNNQDAEDANEVQ